MRDLTTIGTNVVKQAVAGLIGLGIVGGAGAVTYGDDGTAEVTITDAQGHEETVEIAGDNGKVFMCPDGTDALLEPIDIEAGRIKITMRRVGKRMDANDKNIDSIDKRYPGREAPGDVVDRYNRLVKRDKRLVKRHNRLTDAYNAQIDKHNAVLDSECEPE